MAQKSLREFDGKGILQRNTLGSACIAQVAHKPEEPVDVALDRVERENPWVRDMQLVVKPDVLIKRRGKSGLLLLNASWEDAKAWLRERLGKPVEVEGVSGDVTHFICEPFLPHEETDEYYVCISSNREGDEILFHDQGGINIGDVDSKAVRLLVKVDDNIPTEEQVTTKLLHNVPEHRQPILASYITRLMDTYRRLFFTYCEINPLVVVGTEVATKVRAIGQNHGASEAVVPLDLAAKVDEAASYLVSSEWGDIDFPAPFGRKPAEEEAFIHELDSKTGASLKLTILNRKGRVWTMVAGGGASVVYADTISDLGWGHELANYGEYSGAPTEDMTYQYAKTILSLMVSEELPGNPGKVLIIGGGIANFTDVAKTFKGIIRALKQYKKELQQHNVTVWVRRGGPNYEEGLRVMRELGDNIGIPIHVHGPETHITAIVPMALGMDASGLSESSESSSTHHHDKTVFGTSGIGSGASVSSATSDDGGDSPSAKSEQVVASASSSSDVRELFTDKSRAIVFGMQTRAVQGMLDFDFLCRREKPSVAAMVFPFSGNHYQKFYWGKEEFMLPVYSSAKEAINKHQDADVFVNFASFRSVYETTREVLQHAQIRVIAVIAEGVPEQLTRKLVALADKKNVLLIGPATVGGIKPGCFRIGNTGGMIDNIVASKLYRPGSVAYVSKSGGMSNELNNIISRHTNGVCEGVAIGGDRYPGSRFLDHLLRYEREPSVKMMVLLGEVGGTDEYEVCEAIKDGRLTKPIVAWCIGTCAKMFPFEVQFGHAGALANSAAQTADAKNDALRRAGARVPANFNDFVHCIRQCYEQLVSAGTIIPKPESAPPRVPMDFAWAKQLGLIRKPSAFVSSISDERGEELLYAGMPISKVFQENVGLGGVVSLLWFQRRLPEYASKFVEMILMVTADHGPAVSGAHNTIVAARAGKDLVSSLCSGLLTVGPRFGGALDAAAEMFSRGFDSNMSAEDFVRSMRQQNKLIMGIGHRVKSIHNPDKRVSIIVDYAKSHFPETSVLDFALEVEKETTKKKDNLILNVDGAIASAFVDMLRSCGAFTKEEADENIQNGCLNGLFVLGRSIGFIGHFLDQKRLKQGLYRHPWDDISYIQAAQDM